MKCKDCPISESGMSEDGDFDGTCVCMFDDVNVHDEESECSCHEEDFDDLILALQVAKRMILRDKEANVCD